MKNKVHYKRQRGFTLIEMLVSATIVMLCIIAIVAMLRKGREIDINDKYRRLARAIVVTEYENPKYHHSQYSNLRTPIIKDSTVIIDDRGADSDITGVLRTAISAEATITSLTGTAVPYIPVIISIAWETVDGKDTISISKYISEAQ